jgi:hypothetical protein
MLKFSPQKKFKDYYLKIPKENKRICFNVQEYYNFQKCLLEQGLVELLPE